MIRGLKNTAPFCLHVPESVVSFSEIVAKSTASSTIINQLIHCNDGCSFCMSSHVCTCMSVQGTALGRLSFANMRAGPQIYGMQHTTHMSSCSTSDMHTACTSSLLSKNKIPDLQNAKLHADTLCAYSQHVHTWIITLAFLDGSLAHAHARASKVQGLAGVCVRLWSS